MQSLTLLKGYFLIVLWDMTFGACEGLGPGLWVWGLFLWVSIWV